MLFNKSNQSAIIILWHEILWIFEVVYPKITKPPIEWSYKRPIDNP